MVALLDAVYVHAAALGALQLLCVGGAAAHPKGALVHVEIGSVAGAVQIVHGILPERRTREAVEHHPRGAGGKYGGSECNVALEHACVGAPLAVGWRAEVHRPRHVGGAVDVLPTRITEVAVFLSNQSRYFLASVW